jgi:hypothetical protein
MISFDFPNYRCQQNGKRVSVESDPNNSPPLSQAEQMDGPYAGSL